jgi:hypothetical protein
MRRTQGTGHTQSVSQADRQTDGNQAGSLTEEDVWGQRNGATTRGEPRTDGSCRLNSNSHRPNLFQELLGTGRLRRGNKLFQQIHRALGRGITAHYLPLLQFLVQGIRFLDEGRVPTAPWTRVAHYRRKVLLQLQGVYCITLVLRLASGVLPAELGIDNVVPSLHALRQRLDPRPVRHQVTLRLCL